MKILQVHRELSHQLLNESQKKEFTSFTLGAMSIWEHYVPEDVLKSTVEVMEDYVEEMNV